MTVSTGTNRDQPRGNGFFLANVLRSFTEHSEADRPFVPLVGGPRLFILFLYASVLVAASLEFFTSQRLWYGSWEIYNSFVFVVSGVFVLLGMFMLLTATRTGEEDYSLPVPRLLLGAAGFVMFSLSGLSLVVIQWNDLNETWAIPLSVTLLYGFLLILLGGRGFATKEGLRLSLYATGLVLMVLVPVHEAFGLARSPESYYPWTLLNLVLLTSGMVLALVAIQSLDTRDGFVGAWLVGAMVIFLVAFHEQLGIVESGNYSHYDRALALIGISFSFLPLVMYAWRERVYIFLWRRLRATNDLIAKGSYPEALKQVDGAIRQCSRVGIEDRFALPWSLKADAHYRMKEYDKAMVHYETALKIDPKDSTSWCHLGNMYALQGKLEDALKAFDEALKIDPSNGFAWNNKGTVYQQLGMQEDALICFDKAISYSDDSFDAHINAAKMLSKMGHSSGSLQHYMAAAELRPQSMVANEGIHKEFHRSMCMDQIAGWEQLGMDTSQLKLILDQDPANFVRRSKEYLKNIIDMRSMLPVVPGKEHIDVNAAIQVILRATEGAGATLEMLKEETSLGDKDIILPLALLMETDHVHFKTIGGQQVYVSRGKVPDKPPEVKAKVAVTPPPAPQPAPVPAAPAPVVAPEPAPKPRPEPPPEPLKQESPPEPTPEERPVVMPPEKPQEPVMEKPAPAPEQRPARPPTVQLKCPGCGENLRGNESKCPLCDLPLETASFDCAICGEEVPFSSEICPKCGAVFRGTVPRAEIPLRQAPRAEAPKAKPRPVEKPKPEPERPKAREKSKPSPPPSPKEKSKKIWQRDRPKEEPKTEKSKSKPKKEVEPEEEIREMLRERPVTTIEQPTASILVFTRKKTKKKR